MNLEQQAEYLAMQYSVENLEATLRVLQDADSRRAGAIGKVQSESVTVVQNALHLRRVKEHIEAAMSEVGDGSMA